MEEASNTELIARILSDAPDLHVPEVMRPWVSERVLVLERIHGKRVEHGHGLDPDRAGALARVFSAYVRQVTVWGVYHADPHRGNVLITDDGRLALLDFGLIGRLADDVRRRLGLLLLALAQNRADDVADLIVSLSLVTGDSDQPGFVHELRRKLPRYHWRPLAGIETGAALADLARGAGLPHPPADELRPRGQDARAGRLDRPHARPRARSGGARRGRRLNVIVRGPRAGAGGQPRRRQRVHAARRAHAAAAAAERDLDGSRPGRSRSGSRR